MPVGSDPRVMLNFGFESGLVLALDQRAGDAADVAAPRRALVRGQCSASSYSGPPFRALPRDTAVDDDGSMAVSMHTAAERPDLWERGIPSEEVWPEYNLHGDDLNRWWQHLDVELADFSSCCTTRSATRSLPRATPVRCG